MLSNLIPTVPVVVQVTGSFFNINVTTANLDPDILVGDFVVKNIDTNTIVDNSFFSKSSPTNLYYSGPNFPANTTLKVYRNTPVERYEEITFASRFDSSTYNTEITRILKMLAERGASFANSLGGSDSIVNEPFGSTWASDTFRGRTAKVIYDKIVQTDLAVAMTAQDLADLANELANLTIAVNSNSNAIGLINAQLLGLDSRLDSVEVSYGTRYLFGTQECLRNSGSVTPGVAHAIMDYGTPFIGGAQLLAGTPEAVLIPASENGKLIELSANIRIAGAVQHSFSQVGFEVNGNVVWINQVVDAPATERRLFARHWITGNSQTVRVYCMSNQSVAFSGDFAIKV